MDLRFNRVGAVAASILLLVAALVGASALSRNLLGPSTIPAGEPVRDQATGNFDQLVVVLMENQNLNDVYGPAAYMTQLADLYSFSEGWASITNPSQPNYIAILGGSTFGVGGDGNHPNLNHPTMVDILENTSKTWKAFAEDASGSGCSLNPPRGEDHFPFLSYTTIRNNSARCANLLPGSSNEVISAFNAGTNFIWLTPNDCNNMHSCSVATGDAWIQSWVPNLLTAMSGKKAALIIMFDEAYTNPPYIYMGFSGPATMLAYNSTASYNHYSLLKLVEDVWGGGNLGQGDVTAPSPLEFFNSGGPDFTLSANPGSVSFAADQSATSIISLTATGGFSGTVALTAASQPSGVAASCNPSTISGTQTSACTLSGTAFGSYTVVVTGTDGTLSHTASIAVTVAATGPTARFTFAPPFPKANNSVAFDASSSTDGDPSATLQARWDWEGDGVWDTPWSATLTIEHVFTTAGAYLVKLEVFDSHGLTGGIGQWVAVQNPPGGDKSPPQVSILSPPNDTVIASENVTVTGVASDDVAISTIELSTDNATWTPTSGTTSWSGSVLLKQGTNRIYARAIDTSGNVETAVITVIGDHSGQGVPPALPDPTVPILIGMSPVAVLAAVHAFLSNQTRARGHGPKKKLEILRPREKGDRWLHVSGGIVKR